MGVKLSNLIIFRFVIEFCIWFDKPRQAVFKCTNTNSKSVTLSLEVQSRPNLVSYLCSRSGQWARPWRRSRPGLRHTGCSPRSQKSSQTNWLKIHILHDRWNTMTNQENSSTGWKPYLQTPETFEAFELPLVASPIQIPMDRTSAWLKSCLGMGW